MGGGGREEGGGEVLQQNYFAQNWVLEPEGAFCWGIREARCGG